MAILKIIEFPDPFLTSKAKPVKNIDQEIIKLIHDMAETMLNAPGVGLAATQVGSDKRIIVYNPGAQCENSLSDKENSELDKQNSESDKKSSENKNSRTPEVCQQINDTSDKDVSVRANKEKYRAIINPEIITASGSLISENEACLSVPDYYSDVRRFSKVTVRGLNIDGKRIQFDTEDIVAVIMQHEIDHLNGILYIDRISALKRNIYKKRIKKRLTRVE
ncbi:MAG: peptide deformylase [Desulfamplus sp.]|nr:peptide deformylase [Desulfamplus sp.]